MKTEKFLEYFPGHHIMISMVEDSSKPPVHYHRDYTKVREQLVKKNKQGHGIFFAVNLLDEKLDEGRHRTKKMVTHCRAVFMDADVPRDKPLNDFPLRPSFIVNTSPGKYHYYWLTDTDDKDTWQLVQNGLINKYEGDRNAKDLTRYLRLPGYMHNKGDPFLVNVIGRSKPKVYGWGEICEAFPPSDQKAERKEREQEDTEHQSDTEITYIIMTAGPGLHGAINKRLLGMKKDGVPKATAIMVIQSLGESVPKDLRDDRWRNRFSKDELERSWEGAQDEEIIVPLVNPEITVKGSMPWPPGLFGNLAKDALTMARFQYNEVAVVSAIGLVAGITGRKFNAEGAGLNVYATLIMDTGMGKDSITDFITLALNTANDVGTGGTFLGPVRFTGPRAVFNSLETNRSQVCVFTEAGLLLNSKSGDGDGLKRVLLGLYTKSGKNKFSGTEMYSEHDKGVKSLRAPALSIINESTPDMLLSVFRKGDGLKTGDIPRQLIYRITGAKPDANRRHYHGSISEASLDKLKHLISKCAAVQSTEDPMAWDMIPAPEVDADMLITEQFYIDMQNENRQSNTTKYAMATRAYYKAVRLAAIASVFNHYDLEIHMDEWQWAKQMIAYEMDGLSHFFQGGMGDPIADIVSRYAIPCISRILNDQLTIKSGLSRKDHKAGKFKLYEFTQTLKNTQEVIELSDTSGFNLKSGAQKLVEYMMSNDIIMQVNNTRAKVYQVTDTFLAYCED